MKTIILLLLAGSTAFAQSSSRFSITRNIVAGGGSTTNNSPQFALDSTVGQPLAAVPSSARFSIQGGFWIRPAPVFFAPVAANGNFLVAIQSELGKTYVVSFANSLTS